MGQLALAQERNFIHKGCTLHLSVTNPPSELKTEEQVNAPTIKLQLLEEGKENIDIELDQLNSAFAS